MASNKRKRIFPKPPQRLSYLNEHELGKNSNQAGYHASLKAIYNQLAPKKDDGITTRQSQQLEKLRANLIKRDYENSLSSK